MDHKQTIEILKNLAFIGTKNTNADEISQALDHAITCVGAIEQIKAERDIAISQLNELGYQFGEKIRSDEK